jgi:hypothetical protein
MNGKRVWIAVAGVVPRDGCELLSSEEGAYVNFLTLAGDEAEYRSKVASALSHYHLELLELCDIRPFSLSDDSCQEIVTIAEELQQNQNPKHVRYSTFHTFKRTM